MHILKANEMSLEFNGSAMGNHSKVLSKGVVYIFERYEERCGDCPVDGMRRPETAPCLVSREDSLGADGFGEGGARWASPKVICCGTSECACVRR